MRAYPAHWTNAQRTRFSPLSALLGVDGLYDAVPVVHITGTNAKGSLCAYMQHILSAAGYRVGWFTSPHLYRETDRIRIGREEIPQATLDRLVSQAYDKMPNIKLFEAYFYAALCYFQDQAVDVAVIEAGIGGAMDATNVVWPALCLTGTIGFDHVGILGDTLSKIAAQKAGIAKSGVPFVLLPGAEEGARGAFRGVCERAGARLYDLTGSEIIRRQNDGIQCFDVSWGDFSLSGVRIRMRGAYQVQNAWTAAFAAHKLNEAGFTVGRDAILQGLYDTVWPGRLEWRDGKPSLLIDGAHNAQGAKALREAVDELRRAKRTVLLVAMMEDKDTCEVAHALNGAFDAVVATNIDYHRALPAERLAALYAGAEAVTPAKAALARAKELAGKEGLVVVAGSLYLPSELGLGSV